MLSRIDELLGQQVAETARRLDGPDALSEGFGPGQQLGRLLTRGPHRDFGHFTFLTADGHGCMALLVGVDPDDHCHEYLLWVDGNREGTPDSDLVHTPLLSHIAARSRRVALRTKASRTVRRQAQREPPRQDL